VRTAHREQVLAKIRDNSEEVNVSGGCLALRAVNRAYGKLQTILSQINQKKKVEFEMIKQLFVHISRVLKSDQMIFESITCDKDMLFFKA
jgi:hypothetical protein